MRLRCLCAVVLLLVLFCVPVWAVRWQADLVNTPNLHTTTLSLTVDFKPPFPGVVNVDVSCLDNGRWRGRVSTGMLSKVTFNLKPEDFVLVVPGNGDALRFGNVVAVDVTVDGESDKLIKDVNVKWTGNDGRVLPWEIDPGPAAMGKPGEHWWPGLHRNNGGHFAWRYEQNGLLIDNINFSSMTRAWYYMKLDRRPESFQLNFGVPGDVSSEAEVVDKGDKPVAPTGLEHQFELKGKDETYLNAVSEADWTSFRWTKRIKTKSGKEYKQELRYGAMGLGIQVETDSPEFQISFQDALKTRGPAGIVVPTAGGPVIINKAEQFDPKQMSSNWLVLLNNDGYSEIPIMIAFQHRPTALEWTAERLVIRRDGGVGTVAIGDPFGVTVQAPDLLSNWTADLKLVPVERLNVFSEMLAAYPWKCKEYFSVKDSWVNIRDQIEFLPWSDDWGTKPKKYSPLPPLVALSVKNGYINEKCISGLKDTGVLTKYGPHMVCTGGEINYRLPVPENWDNAPLASKGKSEMKPIADMLVQTLSQKKHATDGIPAPTIYPHAFAHDMTTGGVRAANFLMTAKAREEMNTWASKSALSALFPQNYRLRRDPITGATYVACTFVINAPPFVPNGEGSADIDYWQGITMYGLYTNAKYTANWETMRRNWPVIRSMLSYWEALNSWQLMGPGAREAGEMFHADMPTAGYAGLVGFYEMAKRLGTPYQRDLSAYLLARNAIPMVAKFNFRKYAEQSGMNHQEVAWSPGMCTGFGENFVASFSNIDPTKTNYESSDPWWQTGSIGPQSSQPEVFDLLFKRCPKDMLAFEKRFIELCPNDAFIRSDDIRFMPHVMLRTWLNGDMLDSAVDLLKKKAQQAYMLRDAHVLAFILAADCPVRLIDWSPALPLSGVWDASTKTARMAFSVQGENAEVKWASKAKLVSVMESGKPVKTRVISMLDGWTVYLTTIKAGKHELVVIVR